MNRKNLFLLIVVITGALAIMSGCMVPQVGAPGPRRNNRWSGGDSGELFYRCL